MQAEGKQGRNTKNRQTSYILILLKSSKICDWLIGTGRVPELLHLTVRIHRRLLPLEIARSHRSDSLFPSLDKGQKKNRNLRHDEKREDWTDTTLWKIGMAGGNS